MYEFQNTIRLLNKVTKSVFVLQYFLTNIDHYSVLMIISYRYVLITSTAALALPLSLLYVKVLGCRRYTRIVGLDCVINCR